MRPNRIKQMWRDNQCVTMGWLSISNAFTAEIMARQGFDALNVDMQHGLTDMANLWPMLQAISQTDTVPVVRVATNESGAIMKALDLGAYGIIIPLVNTAEDAAGAVMSETKEGLANLEAICRTPGLDGIYIGPADLSYALGLPPGPDKKDAIHMDACDRILKTAHAAGIKACMHCASAAFAADSIKRGFDLVMLTSDLSSMIAGVRRQLEDLKAARA